MRNFNSRKHFSGNLLVVHADSDIRESRMYYLYSELQSTVFLPNCGDGSTQSK